MANDLNQSEEIKKTIYANDITIITTNKNLNKAKNYLERGQKQTKEWADTWDLKLNLTKSNIYCFTDERRIQLPKRNDNVELEFPDSQGIIGQNIKKT